MRRACARVQGQRGVTLLVTMLILVAVMLVGASAARMALQGEQAARAGRDRQVAFQAAEDALMDGERDVIGTALVEAGTGGGGAPGADGRDAGGTTGTGGTDGAGAASGGAGAWRARSALFALDTGLGFVDGCGTGPVNAGLCARAAGAAAPAWQTMDLSGAEDGGVHTVQFGGYSGASMQTGSGFLPFRRPRYLIEHVPCHQPGDEVGAPGSQCFRVTAIGFGARPATEVVLQSVFRRAE
ncbi:MAG TPA: PilX N-terminal domain-containing pilus assembly protein [Burkholderiaceae bacterium]|nr:PilX N-terminal domain-containing pilus assembly protein [Burkholderiaceae bacterium]